MYGDLSMGRRFSPKCENLEPRCLQSSLRPGDAAPDLQADSGANNQSAEVRSAYHHAMHYFARFKHDLNPVSRHSQATEAEVLALGVATVPLAPVIDEIKHQGDSNDSGGTRQSAAAVFPFPTVYQLMEDTDFALLDGSFSDDAWAATVDRANLYHNLAALGFTSAEADEYVSAARTLALSIGCSSEQLQRILNDGDRFVLWHNIVTSAGTSFPIRSDIYVYLNNNKRDLFVHPTK